PFGNSPPEEDPDGDGILFTLNLRFPGQYYDRETNLNYNYYRDYDPLTGRYIQADPIGLEGGSMSLYTYANQNPVSLVDPLGLSPCPQGTSAVPAPGNEDKFPQVAICKPDPSKDPNKKECVTGECVCGLLPAKGPDSCDTECGIGTSDAGERSIVCGAVSATTKILGGPSLVVTQVCKIVDKAWCKRQCEARRK
ncbi:RHS repeat-associated core domain-containing protein, partial [Azonexus sp.]|uniref:RHS repeat domain-containing protein n=1 Tax=Azonexus sp. TaxID=1872668 RepID=UPI0028378AFB